MFKPKVTFENNSNTEVQQIYYIYKTVGKLY